MPVRPSAETTSFDVVILIPESPLSAVTVHVTSSLRSPRPCVRSRR